MRNTAEHAHQWGPEAQEVVGREDATILEYFCGRFPHFFIGAWEWACGEGDCLDSTSLGGRLEPALHRHYQQANPRLEASYIYIPNYKMSQP